MQSHAQNNLIPVGNFEDYIHCPSSVQFGNLMTYCLPYWNSPNIGSPDYFNYCGTNEWWLPTHNVFGGQEPLSGDAFIGIYCFTQNEPQGREYIQVQLTQPIEAGVRYQVGFHVSLADMSLYAISSLGAYLSTEPPTSNEYWVMEVEPQIQNPAGNIIADTSGWVLITDTFISRHGGGEQWLTIGNFNYAADSDTFRHQPIHPDMGNFFHSYYYIDDVSVVALDSVPDGIDERAGLSISVYPNPTTSTTTITWQRQTQAKYQLQMFDAQGRRVTAPVSSTKNGEWEIDMRGMASGIYFGWLAVGDPSTSSGQGFKVVRE